MKEAPKKCEELVKAGASTLEACLPMFQKVKDEAPNAFKGDLKKIISVPRDTLYNLNILKKGIAKLTTLQTAVTGVIEDLKNMVTSFKDMCKFCKENAKAAKDKKYVKPSQCIEFSTEPKNPNPEPFKKPDLQA